MRRLPRIEETPGIEAPHGLSCYLSACLVTILVHSENLVPINTYELRLSSNTAISALVGSREVPCYLER
jgi:hypothetical protein